jgi:hypothetical protein
MDRVNRRMVLAVAGWLAAALVATAVGVAAVSLLGEGISDSAARPLSQDEVRRALARSTPGPTGPATPSAGTGPARSFTTAGGTVVARCAGAQATLVYWTPAQGFHAEDVVRGPAPTASLKFESDDGEIRVGIDCASGTPRLRTESEDKDNRDDDDGGSNRGRGGGGGNSGPG